MNDSIFDKVHKIQGMQAEINRLRSEVANTIEESFSRFDTTHKITVMYDENILHINMHKNIFMSQEDFYTALEQVGLIIQNMEWVVIPYTHFGMTQEEKDGWKEATGIGKEQ